MKATKIYPTKHLLIIFLFLNFFSFLHGQKQITVDPGGQGDFTDIQSAFASINGTTLVSDVEILIKPGEYDEKLSLENISNANSDYSVTIRSESGNASDVVLKNSAAVLFAGSIIDISNVKNITFRDLSFIATKENIEYLIGFGEEIDGLEFSNNIFGAGNEEVQVYTFYDILNFSGRENPVKNISIHDNEFKDVHLFFVFTLEFQNVSFEKNNLELKTERNQGALNIWPNIDGLTVAENIFDGYGIGSFRNCSDAKIYRNKVITDGGGMQLTTDLSGEISDYLIYNNFIIAEEFGVLYFAENVHAEIVNNNFLINGRYSSAAITISMVDTDPDSSSLRIYNNNLVSKESGADGIEFAINPDYMDKLDMEIDYNNYFFPEEDQAWFINLADIENLTLEQVWSIHGFEENGLFLDPLYTSEFDLHSANGGLKDKGNDIEYITEDIDGDERTGSPDIGADEIKGSVGLTPVSINEIIGSLQGGKTILFRYEVRNSGSLNLSGEWIDAVYLSSDQTLDDSDRKIREVKKNLALEAGGTYTGDLSIDLPTDLPGGNYYLILNVNDESLELDENLADNVLASDPLNFISPELPDLQVSNIITPATQFSGKRFELKWTVTNSGEGSTPDIWQDYIFVANDPDALNDPDILNSDSLLAGRVGAPVALNPGESYNQTFNADIPLRYSGKLYYRVQANAKGLITEIDPSFNDNGDISDVVNISQSPLPDLVVNEFNAPSTAFSGEKVAVNWEVENVGQQSTYRTSIQLHEENWLNRVNYNYWYDNVYISRKPYFDPEEKTQRQVARYNRPTEELEAGHSYTVNDSIEFESCDYGWYYIFVMTNADLFTYELDAQNNFSILDSIEVIIDPKPDLLPVDLSIAGSAVSGKQITISYEIRNDGFSDKDDRRVLDYFYISATDTFNVDSSIYLGYESVSEALPQNSSYTRSITLQLPYDRWGDYNLYLKTDFMDNVCEVQGENNNTLKEPVTIELADQPDLIPEFAYLPDTLVAGENYRIRFTVENRGDAGAIEDSWSDRFMLGNKTMYHEIHSNTLDKGAAYDVEVYFTVPFDTPDGEIFAELFTDSRNTLFEHSGEQNNIVVSSVYIKRDPASVPDLTPVDVQVINSDLTAGDTLVLDYTVSNNSVTTPVNGWKDRIRLINNSGDVVWEDEVSHFGNISEGANFEGTHRVQLPYTLEGSYDLELLVNKNNEPVEYIRDNNTIEVSADVAAYEPPDLETDLLNYSTCCNLYALQQDSITLTIRNNGPGDIVDRSFTLKIELSKDETGSNPRILTTHRQKFTIGSDEEINVTLPVKFGASLSGNYYTLVHLDTDEEVYEGKEESNNRYVTAYTVNIDNEPIRFVPVSLTINSETTPSLGSFLSVSYTIDKGTEKELRRYVEDQIILSMDKKFDAGDYRFANYQPTYRSLSAGESSYEDELTAVMRSYIQPGWYYIGVKADVHNNVLELDETNNVLFTADSFYLDFTIPLGLDQPYTGSFYEGTVNGQEVFSINRPADKGMYVTLDFSDEQASSELYHRVGEIPTSSNFDNRFRDPFLADQEIVVPVTDTATNDYVRLIANRVPWVNNSPYDFECWMKMMGSGQNIINFLSECEYPDTVPYTIVAESAEFSIIRSFPDSASHHGVSNLRIEGFDFDSTTNFFFVRNTDSIHARRVELLSSTEVVAVFDFRDRSEGIYDLVAQKSTGENTKLENYFTVFEGGAPRPWASVNHSVRVEVVGRKFYVNVDFGNRAYMNGYDYWLLVAVANESFEPERLTTTYIGSSSEEIYEQLEFNPNPTGDSTFVDIDGIRYYAYWIPVLPPQSQTTFSYIFQSNTAEFVLTQARIYEQQLSEYQLQQDIEYLDRSVTLNKIVDVVFEQSAGFEPATFSSKKSGGDFDCSNIDMRKIEAQIANDVKSVAENTHGGFKTYKGATSIEEVVEIAIKEKKKEFTDAINVPENLKSSHKKMAKEQLKSLVKKEKGTIQSTKDYATRVFEDTDPTTQVKSVLEPDDLPFEDLINNTFSCLDQDNITKEVKRCYIKIRDHNGNYKYSNTGKPGCTPPGDGGGSDGTDNVNSKDPNAIVGPEGKTDLRLIGKAKKLKYTIQFENVAEADAPARFVSINNELPEGLRPQTFVLKEFGFGDTIFSLDPSNRLNMQVDLGKKYNNMVLDLVAGLDIVNNRAFWRFSTIDPETGNLTVDPFNGFLPPNDSTGIGEGFVSYEIYLEPDVEGGTEVNNQAEIIFDQNEIIPTNVWSNTVVSSEPLSRVNDLPGTSPRRFTVSWSGSPGENSAGISGYNIYVSKDDEPFELLLENTLSTSARFEGEHGSTYEFYSILIALNGEEEPVPETADASTTIDTTMVSVKESTIQTGGGSIVSNIYPNPASDWLKIEYSSIEDVQLMLYDVSGRLLMNKLLRKTKVEKTIDLDLRDYDDGVLILQLVNAKDRNVYRVVKF